jgi:hypothetical protein
LGYSKEVAGERGEDLVVEAVGDLTVVGDLEAVGDFGGDTTFLVTTTDEGIALDDSSLFVRLICLRVTLPLRNDCIKVAAFSRSTDSIFLEAEPVDATDRVDRGVETVLLTE